ncbi:class I SAM-dependent methyltransferase [Hansschlegelia sp. KR7-227]|uniref:class I SAM-dependent methyltransferase n=1 Tax=Hansschlegelia sp. KR7-227 TaxID=3400914 RepID=UPI003C0721F6
MDALPISAAAKEFIAQNYKKPDWATGAISPFDASFLYDLITRERPKSLLEIGVASGTSTAFLSSLIESYGRGKSHLHSYDALPYFYAKHDIECGAFVKERFGKLPSNLTLNLGVSSQDIPSVVRGQKFDFAFVDANHDHPWPTIDLLSVIETTAPGSWVALHDINLPFLSKQFPCYGPHYLYEGWPGDKVTQIIDGGIRPNIGAIRLFSTKEESIRAALDCLAIRWQKMLKAEVVTAAESIIRRTSEALADDFLAVAARRNVGGANNLAMQGGDIRLTGFNAWSRLEGSPWLKPFVLHANPVGNVATTLSFEGLQPDGHRRVVFPAVKRCSEASDDILLKIVVRGANGDVLESKSVVFQDDQPKMLAAALPTGSAEPICVDVTVSVPDSATKIRGAWLHFDPVYCS